MKSNIWRGLLFVALAVVFAIPASAGELKLTINSGRATVIAVDVPVAQLIQEWSRVGHTRIVNGDRLAGPPISIRLVDVPEKDALDIILRSASGYVAAPREQLVADASMYDRIMIMPTSFAPAPSAVATAAPPQSFQRPPAPAPVDDEDEPVTVNVPPPAGNQIAPQPGPFSAMPGPQPANGQQNAPGPFLSSTPGVVVGTPANGQPAQLGQPNPYQPAVVKPVGGGGGGA